MDFGAVEGAETGLGTWAFKPGARKQFRMATVSRLNAGGFGNIGRVKLGTRGDFA